MSKGVYIQDNITKDLKNMQHQFKNTTITVGIDEGAPQKTKTAAYIQEFGFTSPGIPVTPAMRRWFAFRGTPLRAETKYIKIPARPFISGGISKFRANILGKSGSLMKEVYAGKITMDTAADNLGQFIVAKIKDYRAILKAGDRHPITMQDRFQRKKDTQINKYLTYSITK